MAVEEKGKKRFGLLILPDVLRPDGDLWGTTRSVVDLFLSVVYGSAKKRKARSIWYRILRQEIKE